MHTGGTRATRVPHSYHTYTTRIIVRENNVSCALHVGSSVQCSFTVRTDVNVLVCVRVYMYPV